MEAFFALVDARPGHEDEVEAGLAKEERVRFVRVKERSHDFLVRVEAPDFHKVDDLLQTYVRTIPGVSGVEVVLDWDDYGKSTRDARDRLA